MEEIIGVLIGYLLLGCFSFFLTKFLFRFPARNFLAAKICFGFWFLGGLVSIVRSIQEHGGLYADNIDKLFLAIGAACGYWYGWKKLPRLPRP